MQTCDSSLGAEAMWEADCTTGCPPFFDASQYCEAVICIYGYGPSSFDSFTYIGVGFVDTRFTGLTYQWGICDDLSLC